MAFKSPCVVSSACNCGGGTCNSLRCGREIQAIDRKAGKSLRKIDLGPVPSPIEVDAAVTQLQSFLQESFSLESMSKWLQPLTSSYDSSILHSDGYRWLCKGFKWLLTDPTFKVLVVSLCLDKDVWDAIRNNEITEKLQELPSSGGNGNPGNSKQGPDFINFILRWILEISLKKILEGIQDFVILLKNVVGNPGREKLKPEEKDEILEKINSAFFLALIIMLIVVVGRVQIA